MENNKIFIEFEGDVYFWTEFNTEKKHVIFIIRIDLQAPIKFTLSTL